MDLVQYLCENKANENSLDDMMYPMLCYPITRNSPFDIQIIEILLKFGGNTALIVGDSSLSVCQYTQKHALSPVICDMIKTNHSVRLQNIRDGLNKSKSKVSVDPLTCAKK